MISVLQKKGLVRSVLGVTLFNFIGALIGFGLNVYFARYFGVEGFGKLNLFVATFLIFYTIIEFGFSNFLVIENSQAAEQERLNIKTAINSLFYIYSVLILIVAYFVILLIDTILDINKGVLFIALIAAFFFAVYRYFISHLQADGKWSKFNVLNVLNNFLKAFVIFGALLVITFLLKQQFELDNYYFAYFIFTLLLVAIVGILLRKQVFLFNIKSIKWTKAYTEKLIPLGITSLLIIIATRVDNYIIELNEGSYSVGIYSAANSLAMIFPLFTSSIMKVLIKESASRGIQFLERILFIQKKYIIYLVLAVAVVCYFANYIIPLLFGNKYEQSIIIFQILIVVYFGGVFFTPLESYYYANKSKVILMIKIIQVSLILLLGFLLTLFWGIIGMAVTIVISRLVAWGYFWLKSKTIINEYYSKNKKI